MNLGEYSLQAGDGYMHLYHKPTGDTLIKTMFISLDTVMRLITVHDASLRGIRL